MMNRFTNSQAWIVVLVVLLMVIPAVYGQTFTNMTTLLDNASNGSEWGTTAADFNSDGWTDIYERDKLYMNINGESFVNVFNEVGMDQGQSTFGAVFGDYNNDGYLDILFENFGPQSKLNRNNGNRTFTYINEEIGLDIELLAQTCGWADYNLDGTLDLFLDDDHGDNIMLKNIRNDYFEDVSSIAGAPTEGNSYGMSWGDFNNDGYSDVFIATCPGGFKNHLLRNNGDETFTNIGPSAGIDDTESSWGIVWIDYNCDGYLDAYIANTGSDPNRLYRNNGDETFSYEQTAFNVVASGGYGAAVADFDNDGWPDIYAATGGSPHKLYRNNGDGSFTNIASEAGIMENGHDAVAIADYNNDGWIDIFTAGGPQNRLMYNDGGTNHWIVINTRGKESNFYGAGARIEVWTSGHKQIKDVTAGDSFCSQNDLLRSHFGLGDHEVIDTLIVKWQGPGSTVDKLYDVPVDQYITVVEGIGINNAPGAISLVSPADGEEVSAVNFTLEWTEPADEEGDDLTYRAYVTGPGLDSTFTSNTNSVTIPGSLLQEGANYRWLVDVTDGHSIIASMDMWEFNANPSAEVFEPVLQGAIVSDDTYSEGGAWADYDMDGDLDLFVSNIIGQNNLLYQNNGDGSFTQVTEGDAVNDGGFSYGANFVDYDQDGDADLYVANRGEANFLYENVAGELVKVTTGVIATDVEESWSSSWADLDNDGDLELFVANYNQANSIYENLGDGIFVKLSDGDVVNDIEPSLGHSFADYDDDGDLDLFVSNANFANGTDNSFYRNDGGLMFTKVTDGDVGNDGGNSVASSWGDFDNDGDQDLFVTNYFGENNFLYINDGAGTLIRSETTIISLDGGYSVGSAFEDYDNDGDLDLWVSDDYDSGDNSNRLYENTGNGAFLKVNSLAIVTDQARSNSGTFADIDNDGDLDLFVCNGNQAPTHSNFLYVNVTNGGGSWLHVTLEGNESNLEGVGAKVRVLATIGGADVWQMREISTQTGYNSQSSLKAEFGLGDASQVDSVVVEWPSGIVQRMAALDVNENITVIEQGTTGIDVDEFGVPVEFSLEQNYPNPFNPSTTIAYGLPEAMHVELAIYNILGQQITTLVNAYQTAGVKEVVWDGRDATGAVAQSGIYFYRITAGNNVVTNKMILMK